MGISALLSEQTSQKAIRFIQHTYSVIQFLTPSASWERSIPISLLPFKKNLQSLKQDSEYALDASAYHCQVKVFEDPFRTTDFQQYMR